MATRLEIYERVGEGASAEVLRAALVGERGTRRLVALKRLRPDRRADPVAVELFVAEAKIALELSHPGLVQALELRRDDAGYVLLSEWVEGASLAALHGRLGPLPWRCALAVARALCSTLAYLHAARGADGRPLDVVHRDVAPGNVLVTASGTVKLADLGVAQSALGAGPFAVRGVGTPGFAAPEQVSGAAVDLRADVFGLGALVRGVSEPVPAPVAAVLARACDPDPARRCGDAGELGSELEEAARVAGGGPIGPETLAAWIAQRGGLPRSGAKPELDQGIRQLLGASVLPVAVPVVAAPAPRRRPRRVVAAAAAVVAVVAVAALLLRRGSGTEVSDERPAMTALSTEASQRERDSGSVAGSARTASPASAPSARVSGTTASGTTASGTTASGTTPESTTERSAPPPGPPPRASVASPRPPLPAPARLVAINVNPWAAVSADGGPKANTPVRLRLTPGRHVLHLTHPQVSRDVPIEVRADDEQVFVIDLFTGAVTWRANGATAVSGGQRP